MFNFIRNLFRPRISGTAHRGNVTVYFTDIYENANGWTFSWTSEDGSEGCIYGPYNLEVDALLVRQNWMDTKRRSGARFVHRGVAKAARR